MKNNNGMLCLALENLEFINIPQSYIDFLVVKDVDSKFYVNPERFGTTRIANFIMLRVNKKYRDYDGGISTMFKDSYNKGENGYTLLSRRKDVTSIAFHQDADNYELLTSGEQFYVDYEDEEPFALGTSNLNHTIQECEDGGLVITIANDHYRAMNKEYVDNPDAFTWYE